MGIDEKKRTETKTSGFTRDIVLINGPFIIGMPESY